MNLSDHDANLAQATTEYRRVSKLLSDATRKLDELKATAFRAEGHNQGLAEAQALAALDEVAPPKDKPIDIASVNMQVEEQTRRVDVFRKGSKSAHDALAQVQLDRSRAYKAAYQQYAQTILPPRKTLRQARPSLADYSDVTLGEAWQAYLLTHNGGVGRDPRDFGEYLGQLFAMPDATDAWADLRDAAIIAAEDAASESELAT